MSSYYQRRSNFANIHSLSPEMAVTVQLPILSVKKNPQNPLYTQLGVLTKGTVIEVNVSELGIVTAGGKVAWGKYAQVTNTPENDGCVNAYVFLPRCQFVLANHYNSVLLV